MQAANLMNRTLRLNTLAIVLITLPLAIIIALAVRTIVIDKTASLSRAGEAAQQVAKSYAVQFDTALSQLVAERFKDVQRTLLSANDPVGFLRRIVYERSPLFAVLFQEHRRVFPPEEDYAVLLQERQILAQLDSALARARKTTTQQRQGHTWARLFDDPVLLTCTKFDTFRELCIVSSLDDLQQAIDTVLAGAGDEVGKPVELIDPWGQRQWPKESRQGIGVLAESLELTKVLSGWKIQVGLDTDTGSSALLIAAVVVPVAIGWGFALTMLMRYQNEVTRQHRVRAESAARLSHDLRTPIANLEIYVDLISRHGNDMNRIARYCKALEEEIARLAIIAETTLRRSRGLQPQPESGPLVDADDVIKSILLRYEPLMAKSGCSVTFDAGASAALVDDRSALERILINLIDNACSHAGGSNVKVETRNTADRIVLTMSDDGPRVPARPQKCAGAHGLGLKVVEELAKSRGGTFEAFIDSAGSRFEVCLPSIGTANT